jgi:hypothetical protein
MATLITQLPFFRRKVDMRVGCRGPNGRFAMFKMPAYDPVSIAVMGLGILLVLALAMAY